jgi:hypothetical protein
MGRFLLWVLLAVIVLVGGFWYYQRNIAAIPVTAADLDKGGSYSDTDRVALRTACANLIKKDTDKVCGCIADKAGEASRYQRMVMTAIFQEKPSDLVGLAKGLIAAGVSSDKMTAAENDAKQLHQDMKASCGAG